MGCDIHLIVEKRIKGEWGRAEALVEKKHEWSSPYEEWYTERNYSVFGALAGVREHEVVPIAEPRGIPSDCTTVADADDFPFGDHTYSWLTVDELLGYDWWQTITVSGIVRAQPLDDEPHDPEEVARYVEEDAMEWGDLARVWMGRRLEFAGSTNRMEGWAHYSYKWPLVRSCERFMPVIQRMARVALKECGGNLEAVRTVFGFDS